VLSLYFWILFDKVIGIALREGFRSYTDEPMEKCCICNDDLGDSQSTTVLGQKGVHGIEKSSRGEIHAEVGQKVHVKCRRDLSRDAANSTRDISNTSAPFQVARRSTKAQFRSSENCIFCGLPAKYDGRKKGYDVIPVRTKDFQESISDLCMKRNDEWSDTVRGRLEYARDLHAADAVYHQQCSVNFRTGKQVPQQYCSASTSDASKRPRLQVGRPIYSTKTVAFLKVAKYLEENDEEQITVNDLCEKMQEYQKDRKRKHLVLDI